jgi:hypothetical protein
VVVSEEIIDANGSVAIKTTLGNKTIHDDPYIFQINQNLLSLRQNEEMNCCLNFKNKKCTIHDTRGSLFMMVAIKGLCFNCRPNS